MAKLHTFSNPTVLAQSAAGFILDQIQAENDGPFSLGLAGGSTPKETYGQLADMLTAAEMDLTSLHFFWGDERCVPPDDPDSNFRMANQTLLSKLSLSDDQIHPMGCDQDPERAAAHYEQLLRQFFKGAQPRFDLILLGLGPEGHTASLFPGSHLLHEQERWVAAEFVEAKEAWRCTLTPPALNAARTVVFLVQGEAKAEAVLQVIKGDHQPDQWPAQIIEPTEGELHWFMDEAAAGLL